MADAVPIGRHVLHGGHHHHGGDLIHNCPICDGGLAYCVVCRGGEASLPRDCPGEPMTDEQSAAVQAGTLDFLRGRGWTKKEKRSA